MSEGQARGNQHVKASEKVPLDPKTFTVPVAQGTPGADVAMVSARRAQAVALRLAGLTYEQIAKEVGYADRSVARLAVVHALHGVQVQGVEALRSQEGDALELEIMRLDRLTAAIWQRAVGTGAMPANLDAIAEVRQLSRQRLKLMESRRKLFGIDAPLKVEVSEGVDEELGALRAALAADPMFVVIDGELADPPAEQVAS